MISFVVLFIHVSLSFRKLWILCLMFTSPSVRRTYGRGYGWNDVVSQRQLWPLPTRPRACLNLLKKLMRRSLHWNTCITGVPHRRTLQRVQINTLSYVHVCNFWNISQQVQSLSFLPALISAHHHVISQPHFCISLHIIADIHVRRYMYVCTCMTI